MAYRNPIPMVYIVIGMNKRGAVLIERENEALSGGIVDYSETLEHAAIREAREETCLEVELEGQFHAYSDPGRDESQHNISIVFLARAEGVPKAASDARNIGIFTEHNLPEPLAFGHADILGNYFSERWMLKEKH